MNLLLWILQIIAALMYASSGVMKTFMLAKIRVGVRSFDGLPNTTWKTLGLVELVCAVGLILPDARHWQPILAVLAAAILAAESVLFIWVHAKFRETSPLIMCAVLGLMMAFVAYGRAVMGPLS